MQLEKRENQGCRDGVPKDPGGSVESRRDLSFLSLTVGKCSEVH